MKIYLADLFHTYQPCRNPDTVPYTVPLGIGYLAATVKHRIPHCEVHLFRDPDRLLKALRAEPPTLMGFSLCSWNSDLTRRMSEVVKATCPNVISVGGGPSVDDADDQIAELFGMFPAIDFFVPNEGESGFVALVQAIERNQEREQPIPGVAYLDHARRLVRGRYERPVVPGETTGVERLSPKQVREIGPDDVEVPSPYLDGTLDTFLDEGLVPIIQTMRGCPYQCHFCVSGATEWNRMRGYDLERVKAEIDYALSKGRTKDLILTDENWGILGDRDVELARFIMERNRTSGAPSRLYYYTAKIVTPASREIVEMVAPIAWIGEFSMSFQSLNPQARAAIKRTNISMDKLAANVQWARERNIRTSSEMIYGFPYETPQTFFEGIERLLQAGMSSVFVFPLQLFPGIDLASPSVRAKYGFETRFRLADCGYGIYDDGKLISVETEEIVVANHWSTDDDYFKVRRYGFFQQAILGRGYFGEFFRLCSEIGIPVEPLIRHLVLADYAKFPALAAIVADHRHEAEAELKPSKNDVYRELVDRIRARDEISGVKVNLVYLGKLFSSPNAVRELLQIIQDYVDSFLEGHPDRELVLSYLTEVLPNRIVLLRPDAADRVRLSTRFDYSRWASRSYRTVSELLLAAPRVFEATTCDELKSKLIAFDPNHRSDLQAIFDKTPSKFLLRNVAA